MAAWMSPDMLADNIGSLTEKANGLNCVKS
jgi:hypothetical protein